MPGRRGPGPKPGPKPGPGGARSSRRRSSRRRRRRRRIVVGGAVVLAGSAAAHHHKISEQDAAKIEEYTGQSVEELSDEELTQAMDDLGVEDLPMDENDEAAIAAAGDLED